MRVRIEDLTAAVFRGVRKLGYIDAEAQIIGDVLLYAQLRGNNQGITKIASGGIPAAADVEPYRVVRQNKCGALVTGGHAMVATHYAADLAVELARDHGTGIVGSNHTFSSSGAIGYFARQVADAGFIGLVCVGCPPFVAPYGSSEAKLGTNPLSLSFPSPSGAVVFDTTTAAMAYFGVVEAKLNGEPLPDGTAFDADGTPTTDPATALNGSLATLAGHKGFGLSLFVQLLGGPFTAASFLGLHPERGAGTVVFAIDPTLLVDADAYNADAAALVDGVRAAKPLADAVTVPGERGDRRAQAARTDGELDIADAVWHELQTFLQS